MSWDAIAAIAELVAAVGVIASLIYLALQVRQNTASVRAENLREMVNTIGSSLDRISESAEDRALYLRGRESAVQLSPEERERFWALIACLLANCELVCDLRRDGLVKAGSYEAALRVLAFHFSHAGVREIWEERKFMFADDFQAFVESRIATQ